MIELRIGARTDDECIAQLKQRAEDGDYHLRICDGTISQNVAMAIRDLLLYSDYDVWAKWTIEVDDCYPTDVSVLTMAQAFSARISKLSVRIAEVGSKKIQLLLDSVFRPSSLEEISETLREVDLSGSFDVLHADAASEWLSNMPRVEKLALEERGTPWGNCVPFFARLFELSWHHPREVVLRSTQVTSKLIKPLQKWAELEQLRICGCKILRGVELDRLIQLRTLAIIEKGDFAPLRSTGIIELLEKSESRLTDLDLSGYNLRTKGIVSLFGALESNTVLERLKLIRSDDNNQIIVAVRQFLENSSSQLRFLSLHTNLDYNIDSPFFGDDSQRRFVEILEKNDRLEYFTTGDGDFDSAVYPRMLTNFVNNSIPRCINIPPGLWPLLLTRFQPWEERCEWAEYYKLTQRHADAVYSLVRGSNMLHTVSLE